MSWQATRAAILDGWAAAQVFGSWVGSHSNKLAVAARAGYLMAAGLGWTHLTLTQFALVAGFGEAVLAVFVESTMVSKQRMGERMVEVESRVDEKAEQKADAKVAQMMDSGQFRAPNVP
jgi:hypothetical protein